MDKNVKSPISFDSNIKNKNAIYFNVPGEPFAKQRPRATRKGRFIQIYTPRETKLYEAKVAKKYNEIYRGIKLEGDLTVDIEGIFRIPKSTPKSKIEAMRNNEIPHIKKPDCDNMAKVCLDGLNGIAYDDDAAINRLIVSKRYGDNAMVKITIYENKEKEEK